MGASKVTEQRVMRESHRRQTSMQVQMTFIKIKECGVADFL